VALRPWLGREDLRVSGDLLVVVDDAFLEAGRVRFRPKGGAGGHNGLRSVEAALGTQDYNRLRIGVGRAPEGADLAEWVLSPMGAEDEDRVLELLPELTGAVELWIREGIEAAMNQFNR
jgi:peptidyl-tRNA hydrolase, PTH1 family